MQNKIYYEGRMHSPYFRWGINLFLAILIYCCAELGKLAGYSDLPLRISVVWPPTGISLAAILLFGYGVWPGILLGNVFYNSYHLITSIDNVYLSLFLGILIGTASLSQALIGGGLMRRLSSTDYFSTLNDVWIFLISGGAIPCMIAATVGVFGLHFFGHGGTAPIVEQWLTFWLGDTLGIYVLTPFIIAYILYPFPSDAKEHIGEALLMAACFVIITYFSFWKNYPVAHLYIPICLWAAFRFHLQGATLVALLTSIATLVPTSLGIGSVVLNLRNDPLIFLDSFLAIVSAVTLVVGVLMRERIKSLGQLEEYNRNLTSKIQAKTQLLKEAQSAIFVKEKLASLGLLASGIGRKIREPLTEIADYTKASQDSLDLLKTTFETSKTTLAESLFQTFENNFEILKNYLLQISQSRQKAEGIVDLVLDQSSHSLSTKVEIRSINLHTLLNQCLNATVDKEKEKYSRFYVDIQKEFDPNVGMIEGVAEDLTHAFKHILENSFYMLWLAKTQLGANFKPYLNIRTEQKQNSVEITFTDNGPGLTNEEIETFFDPFPPGEAAGLGLAIAHDIIMEEHHGKIELESVKGEYLQVKIHLPLPAAGKL